MYILKYVVLCMQVSLRQSICLFTKQKNEIELFGLQCSERVLEKESSCMCTLYLLMTIELLTG